MIDARMRRLLYSLAALVGATAALAESGLWTPVHAEGRCALRGQCGSESIFGKQLPCPDNGLAEQPDDSTRQKLVDLCGSQWSEGPVCCREEQVRGLVIGETAVKMLIRIRSTP